ncbi:MAG: head decoration protein [Acetobacteraceae bacterium]
MVTVLTEPRRRGGFLVSEADGTRSREVGKFINSGSVDVALPAGMVIGELAADGSFVGYTNAGTLGAQTAIGVLWDNVTIPAGTTISVTYIARDAEVNAAELQYVAGDSAGDKTAALVDLRALGIIAR